MNGLVYHIVSGHAFFTGIALLMIAVFCSTASRPIFKRVSVLAFVIGLIAVAVSSTPIPYWYYAVAIGVTCAWFASQFRKILSRGISYAMFAVWLIAALMELPYHLTPHLQSVRDRTVAIIGDSVTAGLGGEKTSERWPAILAREHSLSVQEISHVGATAASAMKGAKSQEIKASLVVIEIGGNDLLGSTSAARFERDLDALLAYLAAPDRRLVMFELPLPPFRHEFGRVQRAVAAKHGVALVPKRVFLSVIAGNESTLDTVHLSPQGHRHMADVVWRLIESAYKPLREESSISTK